MIKSAVMHYGIGPVAEFRRDLPVLYVRAGLDRPALASLRDRADFRALFETKPER